jgi:hypothetical protein
MQCTAQTWHQCARILVEPAAARAVCSDISDAGDEVLLLVLLLL